MKLIELIERGEYNKYKESGNWNRMNSYMQEGATVYDFGDGLTLRTYTYKDWFIELDGVHMYKDDIGITDDMINTAFDIGRKTKLKKLT